MEALCGEMSMGCDGQWAMAPVASVWSSAVAAASARWATTLACKDNKDIQVSEGVGW